MNASAYRMVPLVLAVLLLWPSFTLAQQLKPIQLLEPQMGGGRPLMQALKDRASSRNFSPENLPIQMLANMLWAAFGVNRPASGGRTAPSASNSQEMDIYVAMADGLSPYDAKASLLKPVLPDDIRALTGRQSFVDQVYWRFLDENAADLRWRQRFVSAAHSGFISQNVYTCRSGLRGSHQGGSVTRRLTRICRQVVQFTGLVRLPLDWAVPATAWMGVRPTAQSPRDRA
jgi:hypothetical protein